MTTALVHQPDLQPAALDKPLTKQRRAGVIVGGLIAALTYPTIGYMNGADMTEMPAFFLLLDGSLLASIPMALRGNLGSQVLARALWWQGALMGILGVGIFILQSSPISVVIVTTTLPLGCIIAIISAGRAGLQQHSARFAPVAFRGGLMLSMVLALADTQALLLYGALESTVINGTPQPEPFFASAGVMVLALWGLWNMKMWGFLLNIVANVVIAGLALSDVFRLPDVLAASLVATAAVQLLIPVPMIRAMIRSRRRLGV